MQSSVHSLAVSYPPLDAFQHSVVVTLDVDLENPPELIPTLLKVFMS